MIEPSCFANDLSVLVRLPGPIRSGQTSKQTKANAPREVIRLVNWLMDGSGGVVRILDLWMPFLF